MNSRICGSAFVVVESDVEKGSWVITFCQFGMKETAGSKFPLPMAFPEIIYLFPKTVFVEISRER